jgi:hypothetical protein
MTIGRSFPIRNADRSLALDPMVPGDTDRTSPLPFQIGVGAAQTVETSEGLVVTIILQSSLTVVGEDDGGGGSFGAEGVCNPVANQFCGPTGTIVRADYPTGIIVCGIT